MRRFTASAAILTALPLFAAPLHGQSIAGGAVNRGLAAFGASVAISQSNVLVGEPFNQMRTGLVYVYRKSGTRWASATQIAATDGKAGDGFGASMAVNGATLLVGATRQNENRG